MRTIAGVTAALMACMTLWSCDQQPAATAPAAPPPPPQACNCQMPPPPVAAVPPPAPVQAASVAPVRRHRWHHHASRYSENYSQQAPEADYDYVSPSRGYAPPPPPRGVGWIDGYGRPHFASTAEIDYYVRRTSSTAAYLPQRMDPWHKYDERCDWR